MIRLPGWKPPVIASMSRKPEGVPVSSVSPVESFSSRSTSSWRISSRQPEVARLLVVGDLEEQLLGPLGELARLAVALVDPALDLLAGAEQAAQQRVLLDDLGVVLGVAGRRDLRRQLGDVVLAAGLLDLVALGQRLGDAQLVDRLRGRVEVVDAARRSAGGCRGRSRSAFSFTSSITFVIERLGDQHRAEDRLLGLDVLGRDVSCRRLRPIPVSVKGPRAADSSRVAGSGETKARGRRGRENAAKPVFAPTSLRRRSSSPRR